MKFQTSVKATLPWWKAVIKASSAGPTGSECSRFWPENPSPKDPPDPDGPVSGMVGRKAGPCTDRDHLVQTTRAAGPARERKPCINLGSGYRSARSRISQKGLRGIWGMTKHGPEGRSGHQARASTPGTRARGTSPGSRSPRLNVSCGRTREYLPAPACGDARGSCRRRGRANRVPYLHW